MLLLVIAATARAQEASGKLLEQAVRGAFSGLPPVPPQDQADILPVMTSVLGKYVTFRPDGTASTIYTGSGRQYVEWKNLVVGRITMLAANHADQLNGISKRCTVAFSCDCHRAWDAKTNAWSPWHPVNFPLFPAAITLEWKNGACVAAESTQLKWFTPGPGLSNHAPQPEGKSLGLPPGMTREK